MAIDARHVSKSFAKYVALRDVDLHVAEGELVALLGPSGSGKTTLLRIIAGLDTPDDDVATEVIVDGQNILDRPGRERRVGFVFQHYALFRHMTVYENIAFGLRVRPRKLRLGEAELRRKVHDLLDLIQLNQWSQHYPAQLSGGQRQRVALARALAIEPSVLLLDEPFGALDAKVRQELRRWLRALHEKIPVTSVLVTHDQEEALEVADRIVIMNQGRIEQIGTPDEVFHHPASEFVVTFLGNVNLFHGRAESSNGADARVFVRPHELDIERAPSSATSVAANVRRVQSAGPLVRLELGSEQNGSIFVELTHERARELGVRAGESVYVRVRGSRIFAAPAEQNGAEQVD